MCGIFGVFYDTCPGEVAFEKQPLQKLFLSWR